MVVIDPPLSTPFGIEGTYYTNPGSPNAPKVTVTGNLAFGTSGYGPHAVYLRNGMTSDDTLGWGMSGNVSSVVPSVTVNSSVPDWHGIPLPWKAKVSSVEAGLGTPGATGAVSYTWTPQQIAEFLVGRKMLVGPLSTVPVIGQPLGRITSAALRHVSPVTPAMGPDDELSPFARMLSSSNGSLGAPVAPPVKYLGGQDQKSLGGGTGDWRSSTFRELPVPAAPTSSPEPGGFVGLLQNYLHNGYLPSP